MKTLLNCSVEEPVTKLVSKYGPALKPDESFNTPLHLAATKGHLEAARELVSHQPKGVKDRYVGVCMLTEKMPHIVTISNPRHNTTFGLSPLYLKALPRQALGSYIKGIVPRYKR